MERSSGSAFSDAGLGSSRAGSGGAIPAAGGGAADAVWRYLVLDARKVQTGPFEFQEMWQWASASYFGPNLLVKRVEGLEGSTATAGGKFVEIGSMSEFVQCFVEDPEAETKTAVEDKGDDCVSRSSNSAGDESLDGGVLGRSTAVVAEKQDGDAEGGGTVAKDEEKDNEVAQKWPMYLVKDATDGIQGPFEFSRMWDWVCGGFFGSTLMAQRLFIDEDEGSDEQYGVLPKEQVDRASESANDPAAEARDSQQSAQPTEAEPGLAGKGFSPLGVFPEFASALQYVAAHEQTQRSRMAAELPPLPYTFPGQYEAYKVDGFFNKRTGRFQRFSSEEHFSLRNIPTDREGRQLSHFIDLETYQDDLKAMKAARASKAIVKPPKGKTWKQVKQQKKRQKFIDRLGPD